MSQPTYTLGPDSELLARGRLHASLGSIVNLVPEALPQQAQEKRSFALLKAALLALLNESFSGCHSFGPPERTSDEACASYFLKFSRNSDATFLAFSS